MKQEDQAFWAYSLTKNVQDIGRWADAVGRSAAPALWARVPLSARRAVMGSRSHTRGCAHSKRATVATRTLGGPMDA